MTPHVTCVCLTADRQAYTDRAVACFLAQTYTNKLLLILDNGNVPYHLPFEHDAIRIGTVVMVPKTIGALRNVANREAGEATDIIAHWDSDDYSHPLRLAWQVLKLKGDKSSPDNLDAIGYRTLLFWRKADSTAWFFRHERPSYCVGTSLMYWRRVWEEHPFPERNVGEDYMWIRGLKTYGDLGFYTTKQHDEPAMVAEIHESNTTIQTIPGDSWTRMEKWDERLKELMKL